MRLQYQKLEFLFEVWFCGMMYIEDMVNCGPDR